MPKRKAIVEFWETYFYEIGYSISENECFCCGRIGKLERAHIVPIINGGKNDADNIHLLCPNCHADSEGINNKNDYFVWLNSRIGNSGLKLQLANIQKQIDFVANRLLETQSVVMYSDIYSALGLPFNLSLDRVYKTKSV